MLKATAAVVTTIPTPILTVMKNLPKPRGMPPPRKKAATVTVTTLHLMDQTPPLKATVTEAAAANTANGLNTVVQSTNLDAAVTIQTATVGSPVPSRSGEPRTETPLSRQPT